jgi:ribosome-binding ATPase YchF (GTP1/OBG family)
MEYRITSDGDYVYVIDENGDQVAKFDMRLGYGQGATKGRRERNARKQADNWIKNKLASEELTPEEKRQAGLEEDVEKFEERITEAGRLREDLAEKIQGRQTGQLLNILQRSILGTGGDISQVEALIPQVQETKQRNLQDFITKSQAKTKEQLAEFVPTEISAEYNLANLEDAMRRFIMSEETQRAQIQAELDQQPEWWESLVSNIATGSQEVGGQLLGYAASDINVKENISQVGMLDNGLPVYLFNYKGDNTPQIGLMAQDVEKVNKDAVTEIDGVKQVYYTKAVK